MPVHSCVSWAENVLKIKSTRSTDQMHATCWDNTFRLTMMVRIILLKDKYPEDCLTTLNTVLKVFSEYSKTLLTVWVEKCSVCCRVKKCILCCIKQPRRYLISGIENSLILFHFAMDGILTYFSFRLLQKSLRILQKDNTLKKRWMFFPQYIWISISPQKLLNSVTEI